MTRATAADVARNVGLYPLYTAAGRFHCSGAIFYLFLSEHLSLEALLELEAIYYVAYVLLEVPSGYFSDRVGRRRTLLVSAVATCLGYGCFALGSSFALFALGQVGIAIGWTFRSGTDTTLHYDSLVVAGRSDEYLAREAIAQRNALAAAALAALVGGVVGAFWLRAAYVVTVAAALVPIGLVLAMREVPQGIDGSVAGRHFGEQLRMCVKFLRVPALAWLFALFVGLYALEHVPYLFIQPYLAALFGDAPATPLAAGTHTAVAALVAAWAASQSVRVRSRLGARASLLGALALQTSMIGLMAAIVHPAIALLLLARNVAPEVGTVLLNAETTPRIPQAQRATYLSVQGLVGRLFFSALLLVLANVAGETSPKDPETVAVMLLGCLAFAVAVLAVLFATRRALGLAQDPDQ